MAWEIVVVDNGSTDHTPLVISEFVATSPVPVRPVEQRRPGLGRARNSGWRATSGGIITFTDDDCYVEADHIDNVARAFSEYPSIGFAGGRVLLHDPTDHPITINESREPRRYPPPSLLLPGEIHGANMMFRRVTLEAIGGFDDDFGAGAPFLPEDVDAQTRASFAGWEGVYDPRVTVRHHHRRKAADMPVLERTYAIGRGVYWAKFALRPDSRYVTLQQWRWRLIAKYRNRDGPESRRVLGQELAGALGYVGFRLRLAVAARARITMGFPRYLASLLGTGKR